MPLSSDRNTANENRQRLHRQDRRRNTGRLAAAPLAEVLLHGGLLDGLLHGGLLDGLGGLSIFPHKITVAIANQNQAKPFLTYFICIDVCFIT